MTGCVRSFITLVLLLSFVASARKFVKERLTSSKDVLVSTSDTIDYTTFRTFQRSTEKYYGLKPGSVNTYEFKEFYKSRSSTGDVETIKTASNQLLTMLCALFQQQGDVELTKKYCNLESGLIM